MKPTLGCVLLTMVVAWEAVTIHVYEEEKSENQLDLLHDNDRFLKKKKKFSETMCVGMLIASDIVCFLCI